MELITQGQLLFAHTLTSHEFLIVLSSNDKSKNWKV